MLKTVSKIKYDRDGTPTGVLFLCHGDKNALILGAFFVFETTKGGYFKFERAKKPSAEASAEKIHRREAVYVEAPEKSV